MVCSLPECVTSISFASDIKFINCDDNVDNQYTNIGRINFWSRGNPVISLPDFPLNCDRMFYNMRNFNQPVTIPEGSVCGNNMFAYCYNFNSPVSGFPQSGSCNCMFYHCYNFNRPVTIPDGVTACSKMFYHCYNYNCDISVPASCGNYVYGILDSVYYDATISVPGCSYNGTTLFSYLGINGPGPDSIFPGDNITGLVANAYIYQTLDDGAGVSHIQHNMASWQHIELISATCHIRREIRSANIWNPYNPNARNEHDIISANGLYFTNANDYIRVYVNNLINEETGQRNWQIIPL